MSTVKSKSGHELNLRIGQWAGGSDVVFDIVCYEKPGAPCKMVCGKYDCTEAGCDHERVPTYDCNAVSWLTNEEDGMESCFIEHREMGRVTTAYKPLWDGMPIEVFWNGDGYSWVISDETLTNFLGLPTKNSSQNHSRGSISVWIYQHTATALAWLTSRIKAQSDKAPEKQEK